jgi:hypothetical protein
LDLTDPDRPKPGKPEPFLRTPFDEYGPVPARLQPANQVFIVPVGSQQHPIEEGFEGI